MAITKDNELNDLFAKALGGYWIESNMTANTDELKGVASLARTHAEDCLRVLEIFSAKQADLDVDPKELHRARGYVTKLLLEVAGIALFLEDSARGFSANPALYAGYREAAQATQATTRECATRSAPTLERS